MTETTDPSASITRLSVKGAYRPVTGAGLIDFGFPIQAITGGAALGWSVCAAAIVGWGRRTVRRGVLRIVEMVSGLGLGLFGLRMLWESAGAFRALAPW
jgi:hypothetical protein